MPPDPFLDRLVRDHAPDGQRAWLLTGGVGARPLTINEARRLSPHAWARTVREVRAEWGWLAKVAKVRPLSRARFVARPLHRDGRSPQDALACAAYVKAAIDGIVDAGVLPDDGPLYVPAVTCLAPRQNAGTDGLELLIVDAEDEL